MAQDVRGRFQSEGEWYPFKYELAVGSRQEHEILSALGGNGEHRERRWHATTAAPGAEKADQFTYDPSDAMPTLGGPLCCGPFPPARLGPPDQSKAESRSDVLVFTTPAMRRDLEVTGPVSLDLYVRSSAVDTDFTGKLVDVWPNGFAQNLTEGILRLRYRNSQEKLELARPGEPYHIAVDL